MNPLSPSAPLFSELVRKAHEIGAIRQARYVFIVRGEYVDRVRQIAEELGIGSTKRRQKQATLCSECLSSSHC